MNNPMKAITSEVIPAGTLKGHYYAAVPFDVPGKYIICIYEGNELLKTSEAFEATISGELISANGLSHLFPNAILLSNMRFGYAATLTGTVSRLNIDYALQGNTASGKTIGLYRLNNDYTKPPEAVKVEPLSGVQGSFFVDIPSDKPGKYCIYVYSGQSALIRSSIFEVDQSGNIIAPDLTVLERIITEPPINPNVDPVITLPYKDITIQGNASLPILTENLSTGRIKHTWSAPSSVKATVTAEEDYSTSIFFSVDTELLDFINLDEEEQYALGISSISHTAQIDWKLNDGPWHYTSDWDTLSKQYSYDSGIYADTGYLYGEPTEEKIIFDLRNDSDGPTELQRKLGNAIKFGTDEYGEDNRLDLSNNTFYFRIRLFVSYFDEENYEDGFILTPWSEVATYGKEPSSSQTNTMLQNGHSEVFDEGIFLSWQNNNALGYRVFRSELEDELGISVTDFYMTSTSFADTNVEPSTTYYYSIKPVLKEADLLNGQDEVLGDIIKKHTVITGANVVNQYTEKSFIILQIDNPNMSLNGMLKEIDPGRGTTPMIISSRSMVPIRSVVESLNGTVSWDNNTRQITLIANGNTVIMWIDKYEINVNGKLFKIDVAPTIINGRTYVPVRFAAENLNTKVYWINTTREAVILN
jgi:hypothetical protein